MNRRALLKLAPALAVVPAAALSGEVLPPVAETPVEALFGKWLKKNEEVEALDEYAEESAFERLWDERFQIEKLMNAAPAESPRDWMLKIIAWTNFGDGSSCDRVECPQVWDEARALVAA